MRNVFFAVCLVLIATVSFAEPLRPARIFSDSMVLQRNNKIPIWGLADKNKKVTVQFHNQQQSIVSDNTGAWKIELQPESAGGPYELTVTTADTSIVFHNVLVGDVWLCSGQSNMEWQVRKSDNSVAEIAGATNTMIRHIKIPNRISGSPMNDIAKHSGWKAALPGNVGDFTAAGYFFAKELYKELQVPIGLINSSWGGTEIETWISRDGFESSEDFKSLLVQFPSLNLDSVVQLKRLLDRIQIIQGGLSNTETIASWKNPLYNDDKWPSMPVPGLWEGHEFPELDGIVWFRKEIMVDAADAGKPADISLGFIDDNDETYLNGTLIGSTEGYKVNRVYHVPEGILKEGKNILAVKVIDLSQGGGIYGSAEELVFTVNNKKQALAGNWHYQVATITKVAIGPNSYPTLLYNALIHPLTNLSIKGVIWYQGESNVGRAYQYRKVFPLLINDWRNHWKRSDLPFYFAQITSFDAAGGNDLLGNTAIWSELREAQTSALQLPNTGMAVTIDINENLSLHPKNKQDVGKRLAALAFRNTYGMKNKIAEGPTYSTFQIKDNKAIISFRNNESGLWVKGDTLRAFEIAGADKKFYPATAIVAGNQVLVSSQKVSQPLAVRYGWADDGYKSNLYNKDGFPCPPFRTDDWKGITEGNVYKKK
jgi:sialate O-acetylesterase